MDRAAWENLRALTSDALEQWHTVSAAVPNDDALQQGASAVLTAAYDFSEAVTAAEPPPPPPPTPLWSQVYGPAPVGPVVIDGPLILDCDATTDSVFVNAGAELVFDPDRTVTLQCRGNAEVKGALRMRPASYAQVHTLRFIGINENNIVGGGTTVAATDIGLWITGHGVLDAQGSPRAAWNRTGIDPTWQPGDDLRAAPQAASSYTFPAYTPGSPVPAVTRAGVSYPTEIVNLTRNVIIGGTPTGRAHVMILGHNHDGGPAMAEVQTIKWVRIEHVGPRKLSPTAGKVDFIMGRYGLHFHHCGDGTRGSLIEGVVIASAGSHAFVPHGSHGVTFRDCIAFETMEHAYWWDPDTLDSYPANATHDTTYDHCAALSVKPGPITASAAILTGFFLGQGTGNRCLGSVAVACGAVNSTTSGFHWPETANRLENQWVFEDCVAHNNQSQGIRAWQNDDTPHIIEHYMAYRNGSAGIDHGAYRNTYTYRDVLSFGNGYSGATQHSLSSATTPVRWERVVLDAAGGAHALRVADHRLPSTVPIEYIDCQFDGASVAAVWVNELDPALHPGSLDFVRCTANGADITPAHFKVAAMRPGSMYRIQRGDGTAYQLRPDGTSVAIASFHS